MESVADMGVNEFKFIATLNQYENSSYVDVCLRGVREGRKPGAFMLSPSYPHMYCFLAWRERIESTHKTHHVGTLSLYQPVLWTKFRT
jgi:hypothetical protein